MSKPKTAFKCRKCGAVHQYALYAAVQLSQGHEVVFTGCPCGTEITLTPAKYRRDKARADAAREST